MTRTSRALLSGAALLIIGGLPWLSGPERGWAQPLPGPAVVPDRPTSAKHDLAKMTPLQRHLYLSAQRGADWLKRANKPDGRFVYGFLPAVRLPMEEDSYLCQIEAACALGRSARFFHNDEASAIAHQAVVRLMLDTSVEKQANGMSCRHSIPPSALVNRPASAGFLVRAIHDLPPLGKDSLPGKDLLDQADQLCNFLMGRLQSDGSILLADSAAEVTPEMIDCFSGPALHGIIRSQKLRSADWKLEAMKRVRSHYEARWKQHKNYPMLAEHSAGFAEAFALTRDRAYAEHVFAMNDWLCTLQYQNLEAHRSGWNGGFMPWIDGKSANSAPDIRSADAAESLAQACRVAQLAGDPARHRRYKEALENCLQFLTELQYSEANTQHFAEWFRPLLIGGFHSSGRDGNLRLDYTVHALNGLVGYLEYVAELP